MKHETVWWRNNGVFFATELYMLAFEEGEKKYLIFFCEIQCFRQVTKALCDAIMTRMLFLSCKFGQELSVSI